MEHIMKYYNIETENIAVIGDWHSDLIYATKIINLLKLYNITYIVHTGDFSYYSEKSIFIAGLQKLLKKNNMILLFVDGNHENHPLLFNLATNQTTTFKTLRKNIWYIPRGNKWTFNGVLWMGIGGAVSINKKKLVEGSTWFPEEEITKEELSKATTGDKARVIITHDAPYNIQKLRNLYDIPMKKHSQEILDKSDNHQKMIEKIMNYHQPDYLFHGHHHLRYTEELNNTTVIGLDKNMTQPRANVIIVDANGKETIKLP